jgi:hypothetical protein
MYKLGIKRRYWFGYKIYHVIGHKTEVLGASSRLLLTMTDGVQLAIPEIHKRVVRTYPEYRKPEPQYEE